MSKYDKLTYNKWIQEGDQEWKCPDCGDTHRYGTDSPDSMCRCCPKCGIHLLYPWQAVSETVTNYEV